MDNDDPETEEEVARGHDRRTLGLLAGTPVAKGGAVDLAQVRPGKIGHHVNGSGRLTRSDEGECIWLRPLRGPPSPGIGGRGREDGTGRGNSSAGEG